FTNPSAWEELTGSQELNRTSSVPAGASTGRSPSSVPRFADSTGDSSNPGQRFSDMASGHRRAVAHTVTAVMDEVGEPPLEPDEAYQATVRAKVEAVVDQLLVGGQI